MKLNGKVGSSFPAEAKVCQAKGSETSATSPSIILAPPPPPQAGLSLLASRDKEPDSFEASFEDFDGFQSAGLQEAAAGYPSAANSIEVLSGSGAQRKNLSLEKGKTHSHKLQWPDQSFGVATASSFRWKVVVLGELTVDLEISAVVRKDGSADVLDTVVLQKHARGDTFEGSLVPARDRRLARLKEVSGGMCTDGPNSSPNGNCNLHVESIMFKFSNVFSWFRAKDVELIAIFESTDIYERR